MLSFFFSPPAANLCMSWSRLLMIRFLWSMMDTSSFSSCCSLSRSSWVQSHSGVFSVFKKHGKNKQSKKSKAETSQIVKQPPGTNFRHLICEVLQRLRSRYLLYTEFAATKRRKNDSKGLVRALDVQLSSHLWSSAVMKLLPLCGKWSNCLKFAGWIASSSTKLLTTALMTASLKPICAADIRGGDLINTRKAAFCASQCSRVHRRQKKTAPETPPLLDALWFCLMFLQIASPLLVGPAARHCGSKEVLEFDRADEC